MAVFQELCKVYYTWEYALFNQETRGRNAEACCRERPIVNSSSYQRHLWFPVSWGCSSWPEGGPALSTNLPGSQKCRWHSNCSHGGSDILVQGSWGWQYRWWECSLVKKEELKICKDPEDWLIFWLLLEENILKRLCSLPPYVEN